jgi:hypothetical protein
MIIFMLCVLFLKNIFMLGAWYQNFNPSYSGDKDRVDCISGPAWGKTQIPCQQISLEWCWHLCSQLCGLLFMPMTVQGKKDVSIYKLTEAKKDCEYGSNGRTLA